MSCYELVGLTVEQLKLNSLIVGVDFVCIDNDGFRNDADEIFFLSAKTALDRVKALDLEEKASIKRYPYDLQMIPNRQKYVGEEISFKTLVSEAGGR